MSWMGKGNGVKNPATSGPDGAKQGTATRPPRIPSAEEIRAQREKQAVEGYIASHNMRMWCVQLAAQTAQAHPIPVDDLIRLTNFFYSFVGQSENVEVKDKAEPPLHTKAEVRT